MNELYLGTNIVEGNRVSLNRDDLTTHALVVGRTGSGKTGLVHVLIEEAVLAGASTVVIDPKGDLTNLLLSFPSLTPEEFAPWVPAGKSPVEEAKAWVEGLKASNQPLSRVMEWRTSAQFQVFTPGYVGANGINLLPSLARPEVVDANTRQRAQHAVSTVLAAIGVDADPLTDARNVFLTELLMLFWSTKRSLPLEQWPGLLIDPPENLKSFDGISVDDFFPRKERMKLASAIVGFRRQAARWLDGPPMDLNGLLMPNSEGLPQVSIFTLRHLSDEDRALFTSMFLSSMVNWMFQAPASGRLRALCVLDEAAGYLPPAPRNPPTKRPLCTLLAQGRAQGLGVLLATQNPNDIDYKALNNVGTWFLGGLRDRDMKRDLEVELRDREVDVNALLRLPERSFMVLTKDRKSIPLRARWTLSYLRGPIEVEDIRKLAPENGTPTSNHPVRLENKPNRNPVCYEVISANFMLIDQRSTPFSVTVTYSTDQGKTWKHCTPYEGANPTAEMESSPEGVWHKFEWDSIEDLGRRYYRGVLLHIQTPHNGGLTFPPFDVCNTRLAEDEFFSTDMNQT